MIIEYKTAWLKIDPDKTKQKGHFTDYHIDIVCPECWSKDIYVTDSRPTKYWVRRRRGCKDCKHRWNTREISEKDFVMYDDDSLYDISCQIAALSGQAEQFVSRVTELAEYMKQMCIDRGKVKNKELFLIEEQKRKEKEKEE